MTRITMALAVDVVISLETTETIKSICDRTGLCNHTVQTAKRLLIAAGRDLSFRKTSVRDNAMTSRIVDLLQTTELTNQAIADKLGVCNSTVRDERKRFHAQERAEGRPVPQCGCGRDRGHHGACTHLQALWALGSARRTMLSLEQQERNQMRQALLEGATASSLAATYGLPLHTVEKFASRFDAADRAARAASLRTRRARTIVQRLPRSTRPHSNNPMDDPNYARIAACLGRGLDPAIADDLRSDMWLALAEGRLSANDFMTAAKKARSKAYSEHAYGARSLDEVDQYGRTLLDQLAAEPVDEHEEDED